jgi:two-component system sensor histidine kinase KdpD
VASEGLANAGLHLEPADRQELVETIRIEVNRLDRLVANLLDLSRLQAGAAAPSPELWTADDLIAQALDELGEDADRVQVELPADFPPMRVDAGQMQRVLVNLLDTALKFSSPGDPVTVRGTRTRNEAIIRVVDRGPGLPQEQLEHVFEPFHNVPGGDGRRGAGLGLAIARGFAEANGGRVWAESRPGQGASFALAVPLPEEAPAG